MSSNTKLFCLSKSISCPNHQIRRLYAAQCFRIKLPYMVHLINVMKILIDKDCEEEVVIADVLLQKF